MNRRQAIATFAAAAAFPAVCATSSPYRRDIAILREALALHPGLYRYSTSGQVERRLAWLEAAYVAATSLEERYLLLSRFLATIRCGHSYCNFFNQDDAIAAALFDRPTRLPFHFTWIDRRMIVTRDPDGHGFEVGSEIVTVNGTPATTLLAELLPYTRADGHNDAKRVSLLGVSGNDRVEYFDVFHGLVFGAPVTGMHRILLRTPTGARVDKKVPAIGLAARQAQMPPRNDSGSGPVWTWSVRPDGVALLTMPSWALYESKWDWEAWLAERLNSLGGGGLIVDLRDNEGGEDCGDALLARLIAAPLAEAGVERRVRFTRTSPSLDPYLRTWDKSFRTLGVGAVSIGNGFLRLAGDRAATPIAPVRPRLTGRVAALIGSVNSSATFQFAQKAKASGLIRLFGESTGGNQRGINGGCFFFVHLPASAIEFDLPLIGYFPDGDMPDAGVAPNVAVARTARDVALGYDSAQESAARWVLEG